jgi:hypothetical protein
MFAENRGDVSLPTTVEAPELDAPVAGGMIGVGTWNTAAEFKDIQVTAPDGKILFTSDFSSGTKGWKLLGDGAAWSATGGALRQTAEKEFIRALAGDKSWTDYTLTLKARKISGAEGFLILFRIGGNEDQPTDLVRTLESFAQQVQASEGIPVRTEFGGAPSSLGNATDRHLLLVAREAIRNAVSHAHAKSIDVSLHFDQSEVCLEVLDDGQGFTPEASRGNGHYGIIGMRERVEQSGGFFEITSAPGKGTLVIARVPFRRKP